MVTWSPVREIHEFVRRPHVPQSWRASITLQERGQPKEGGEECVETDHLKVSTIDALETVFLRICENNAVPIPVAGERTLDDGDKELPCQWTSAGTSCRSGIDRR